MRNPLRTWPLAALFVLLALSASTPADCVVGDSRFGVSGWRSFADLDKVGSCWFLNWGKSTNAALANPDYPYVRMYWRTKANEYTDAQIQDWARTVRSQLGPGVPIWWTASNEPNDRGQANQTPAEFAAGYYQYHKNLRIGDPDCKVLGPSMLNWTFLSDSVWKTGKDWYTEFRELWANDPTYSAYSNSIQGNPYPPMDGFNMHTYDLRGIQGTPWEGQPDWTYLRDQTLACHADLQNWPETKNLRIWNTEYGTLRVATITDTADSLGGFGLWLRKQSFIERWFFFILRTGDGTWQQTVLMDSDGNVNALGKAHLTLSTLGKAEVLNMPHDQAYNTGSNYTRTGFISSTKYTERFELGLNFVLKQMPYGITEMKGRYYTLPRRVRRVTFNYRMTCDTSKFQLEVDVPGHTRVWSSGSASLDQWADIDLSSYETNRVCFGLYCIAANTYTGPADQAKVQINNITFWYDDTAETTVDVAKSLPDYRRVRLQGVVVSAVYPDSCAVQSADRSAGIVVASMAASVGDRCTVTGILGTRNGYRILLSPEVTDRTPGPAPEPVGLNTRASGGGAFGLQGAVVDNAAAGANAAGLSNVGLLVRLAGRVTYVDANRTYYYLDDGAGLNDGSGHKGVRVTLEGQPAPEVGTDVMVTGVCYTQIIGGRAARRIRVRP